MKTPALLTALALLLVAPTAYAVDPPGGGASGKPDIKTNVENPIRDISAMMKKAGELLAKLETGVPTQEEQKKILKELDRLIEMAEQACSSASQAQQRNPSSDAKPQQPQNTSGSSTGSSPMTTESDVLRTIRQKLGPAAPDLAQKWGELPPALRDEIMQLLSEKLPMKYKQLLYLYFKALSEKK